MKNLYSYTTFGKETKQSTILADSEQDAVYELLESLTDEISITIKVEPYVSPNYQINTTDTTTLNTVYFTLT